MATTKKESSSTKKPAASAKKTSSASTTKKVSATKKASADSKNIVKAATKTAPKKETNEVKTVAKGEIKQSLVKGAVKKGATVKFGNYYQTSSSKKEPIEWIVLEVKGDKALLISKYGLDFKQYNEQYAAATTWENCSLRKWLNSDFKKAAFSSEEQKQIKETTISNPDNAEYGTKGGNNTKDKIFCLSLDEANKYFKDNSAILMKVTSYAKSHGVSYLELDNGKSCWWLRSPGIHQSYAARVFRLGWIHPSGEDVSYHAIAVRPALFINI